MGHLDSLIELYQGGYSLEETNESSHTWLRVLKQTETDTVKFLTSPRTQGKFPKYLEFFLNGHPAVLMYPIGFFRCTGFGFRSLTAKENSVYNESIVQIYTCSRAYQGIKGMKFGVPFVLCEGVKDAEVLSRIYPFVFACLTARVSANLAEFLSCFTDKFLLILDSDEAGEKGAKGSKKNLENFGCIVEQYNLLYFKDPGEFLEKDLWEERAIEEAKILQKIDIMAGGLYGLGAKKSKSAGRK